MKDRRQKRRPLRRITTALLAAALMPGQFALKICPDILRRVQLPEHIIAVTGSNGKTSTVEMIAAILRAAGKTVVYNEEGSNQIEGVTTLVLTHSTLGGKVKADVLLIESDERYAARSFRYFHPTEFVITNLYRDQLTRNGHPEWVYDAIAPAIHPETKLILNADDPLSSCFAEGHANTAEKEAPESFRGLFLQIFRGWLRRSSRVHFLQLEQMLIAGLCGFLGLDEQIRRALGELAGQTGVAGLAHQEVLIAAGGLLGVQRELGALCGGIEAEHVVIEYFI